ncbi:MAG: hypothetical protein WA814_08585 [Candidatus Baltobacteraceae bacterium]
MLDSYLAAFLLGIVAGLRTFTAPAVLWLMRHRGPAAYVLGVLALLEFAGDLYPRTPCRTSPPGLVARLVSGGFCGGALAAAAGSSIPIAVALGVAGALVGAYGGLAARLRTIALIGSTPAAIVEDLIAIAGAVAIVVTF